MSDWLQVSALSGPLEDVHRVVPKTLLHCLGCVRRVIVMLEGELSAQSEVLSALNQVFMKDISVFSSFRLLWSLPQSLLLKNTPTAWCCEHKASPLGWYYAGDKRMNKELRFIRPENLFFFIVWELFGCIFVSGFHVSSLRRSLSLVTLPSSPDRWSVAVMFVLL